MTNKVQGTEQKRVRPGEQQITEFLEAHQFRSKHTRATYRSGLLMLFQYAVDAYGTVDPAGWDDQVLAGFHVAMKATKRGGKGLSPHTVKAYTSAARRYLRWLEAAGHLPTTLSLSRIDSIHRERRGRESGWYRKRQVDPNLPLAIVHYDELELPAGDSPSDRMQRLILLRNRALMHVLWATAARVDEVSQMTCNDVGHGTAEVSRVEAKGRKVHDVFLDGEARAAIVAYLGERKRQGVRSRWLFIGHRARKPRGPLTRAAVWSVVKKAAAAVGLVVPTFPHSIRHFRAKQLRRFGVELAVVKAILGHADITTTERVYAPTDDAAVRAAVAEHSQLASQAAEEARAIQKTLDEEARNDEHR